MYSLTMDVGAPDPIHNPKNEYPAKPPVIRFKHKVSLAFVDGSGKVDIGNVRSAAKKHAWPIKQDACVDGNC